MAIDADVGLTKRAGAGLLAVLSSLLLCACDMSATSGTAASPATVTATSPAPATSPGTATPAIPVTSPGNVTGNATVSWQPPQQNADGSALTDMAGFRIYYGSSADELSKVINIDTVGITRYVIDNLSAGTWYFAVAAFNASGIEGPLSNIASKSIG